MGLAAYNAGETAIKNWERSRPEAQNYVQRILTPYSGSSEGPDLNPSPSCYEPDELHLMIKGASRGVYASIKN